MCKKLNAVQQNNRRKRRGLRRRNLAITSAMYTPLLQAKAKHGVAENYLNNLTNVDREVYV